MVVYSTAHDNIVRTSRKRWGLGVSHDGYTMLMSLKRTCFSEKEDDL